MTFGFDGSRTFLTEKTGTENYSYQLLLHLAKIDHDNHYLVYLRPGITINQKDWPNNFKFKILNFKFLWTQLGLAMQTFKDKLDVLFVPAHTLPLIRKPGLKTIMTVHDLGSEHLPGLHQLKQRLYLSFITKFQLKTATKLIAVSNATKADLAKKVGINPSKIDVIYEAPIISKYKNDIEVDILKQFDLQKNEYFLFVGTIQPRKNLERLIRAFYQVVRGNRAATAGVANEVGQRGGRSEVASKKSVLFSETTDVAAGRRTTNRQNPHSQLVLVGSPGWQSDEIYALPKKLGIQSQVKFLGRLDDQTISFLYQNATSLVYPSLFEGFGLPILEAFSHNCPVITSNLSSMPEVAGDAAILVNPYNIEEITNAMIRVKSQDLRVKLIKKGREQLKKFSWDKTARQTLKLLMI